MATTQTIVFNVKEKAKEAATEELGPQIEAVDAKADEAKALAQECKDALEMGSISGGDVSSADLEAVTNSVTELQTKVENNTALATQAKQEAEAASTTATNADTKASEAKTLAESVSSKFEALLVKLVEKSQLTEEEKDAILNPTE